MRAFTSLRTFTLALFLGTVVAGPVCAQINRAQPPGVGAAAKVTEKLGDTIDRTLAFVDERGRDVTLGDYLDGTHPVILTLNYSSCPMLCSLQLDGLGRVLRLMDMSPGEDFKILTVSIDPTEDWRRAQLWKRKRLEQLDKKSAASGWSFLTGREENIRALADSVGFGYAKDPESGEYAHAAAFMVLSPEGKVTRYLYGHQFESRTVRLSLVEAADGKIGSAGDRVILYCYAFDPEAGVYTRQSMTIMRIVGVLTMLALGGMGLYFWRRERALRRSRTEAVA
ncbi:MAG: SCO family protein [Planctomycetota bacterium]